jgi:hypothetical protein
MTKKNPSFLGEIGASLARSGIFPFPSVRARQNEQADALAGLIHVAGSNVAPLLRELTELAKLGHGPEQLARIVHAAEHSQIIAFEAGKVRHIGASRTLREILQEGVQNG